MAESTDRIQENDVGEFVGKPATKWETLAVFASVWIALVWLANGLAIGWDEGYTFDRQEALRPWLAGWREPSAWSRQLRKDTLQRHWRFSREEPDGHGPFYCLLSLAGETLVGSWVDPLLARRIGGITLFALACALALRELRRHWRGPACYTALVLLALSPRLIPEVCYALIDGPLLSLSLLAWIGYLSGVERARFAGLLLFGFALGSAQANKLTGWFLWAPYLAATLVAPRRGAFGRLVVSLGFAGVVCLVWNVGWWPAPIDGLRRFFLSNLTREKTIPIATLYLGAKYPFALPWHNTVVWTFIAAPAMTFVLGVFGAIVAAVRFPSNTLARTLLFNWALLMIVRATPKAPGHDGVRQLVIAFGFFALLAGLGANALIASISRRRPGLANMIGWVLLLVAGFESAISLARYHPHELSYYSPLVGGLAGADKLGFEPTYFWDALTPDVLAWLADNTPAGQWVLFRNNPTSWDYLSAWRKLKVSHRPTPAAPNPVWVVYQNRPGIFLPSDDWLFRNRAPAYEKNLAGVPLLRIYSFDDFQAAQRRP